MQDPTHLLWCDLETTGLHPHKGAEPLEYAFKLTDFDLNELWSYNKVIHFGNYKSAQLATDNPFIYNMHMNNGLLEECHNSDVTVEQVEMDIINFLKGQEVRGLGVYNSQSILIAGSSIHFDKLWLDWFTPEISEALHYRVFDISSFYPFLCMLGIDYVKPDKVHRASQDIERSISQLRDFLSLVRSRTFK